jgi:restriction system protein
MSQSRTVLPVRDIQLVVATLVTILAAQALYFLPDIRWHFALGACAAALGITALLTARAAWRALFPPRARRTRSRPDDATPSAPAFAPAPLVAEKSQWTLRTLRALEWKRFEDLLVAYIRVLGYHVRVSRRAPDGSGELLVSDAAHTPVLVVHLRSWTVFRVGEQAMDELRAALAEHRVNAGAFFTAGTFTDEARSVGQRRGYDLVDGEEMIARFNQLAPAQFCELLYHATRGDYTTPSCPSCGTKMVLHAVPGSDTRVDDFWHCRNHPTCRQTLKVQPT